MNNRWVTMFAAGVMGLSFALNAIAQQEDPLTPLKRRTEMFLRNLNDPAVPAERAFEELLADGPLRGSEQVQPLIAQIASFPQRYGALWEIEFLSASQIGKDVVVLKYLYKMERFPVAWTFVYYRRSTPTGEPGNWFVISVRFDTRLDRLAP